MKKQGVTILEVLFTVVIIIILCLVFYSAGCRIEVPESSYGHNLRLERMDHTGMRQKWHWVDIETGEKFYSIDSEATIIYRDIEHE